MAEYKRDEIATYSDRGIRPLDPDPDDIDIVDIAHALSNQCRFTGHTKKFYSVAQHSVLVSEYIEREFISVDGPGYELEGLLHDASEAYLSDIARPVKQTEPLKTVYHEAEERLSRAIAERFGLVYPFPPAVTEADNVLLVTEARDLMHGVEKWSAEYRKISPLPSVITPWTPAEARARFLWRFNMLSRMQAPLRDREKGMT